MPGKPAGVLDDDDAHAVADHPLEECFEAWPALDRILAANSGVIELADKIEPSSLGEAGDGLALARVACPCRTPDEPADSLPSRNTGGGRLLASRTPSVAPIIGPCR
jgi:hypothetical protein